MFAVDAAVLLAHPPHVVARVTGRLTLLPRWCAGLRRVRYPVTPAAAGCVFTYAAADVRVTLRAHTLADGDAPHPEAGAGAAVTHATAGDGLTLTWTLSPEVLDGTGPAADGAVDREDGRAAAGRRYQTRLRARVEVAVDPGHPLAAARAALCRTVARRVPADLERLRTLLDRYEAAHAPRTARAPGPYV